ncbi:MAG: futalosine hydrolase [Aureispira sp.]
MKLLLVAATEFEILPLLAYLKKNFKNKDNRRFFSKQIDIHILVTGVGPVATSFALGTVLAQHQFDWALNLGIAGAFNRDFKLGEVFQVVNDRFGDLGVEEADGTFTDLFALELVEWNEAPFINGKLYAPDAENSFLPTASAITVSKVHGSANSIAQIQQQYSADLESMEGAAFYYACLQHQLPCLQVRSVSNYVEPRNRANWDIPLAIDRLNEVGIGIIETLVD